MGAVTIWVADIETMIDFYQNGVGLDLISHEGSVARLGFKSQDLVILVEKREMKHASPSEAGLFHTAILFPSEAALARAVYSVATKYPIKFTGSADHLVSKAFYFDDPEGNGVELYWDRDRTQWSWTHGSVEMDTIYLDPNKFLKEHLTEDEIDPKKMVGHVHLCVGSIEAASDFYVKILGFEQTLNWGGQALFVSAGGYHHHMAMNTWRSRGAGKRRLALGLGTVRIRLDSSDHIAEVSDRLKFHQIDSQSDEGSLQVRDPWDNVITLEPRMTSNI